MLFKVKPYPLSTGFTFKVCIFAQSYKSIVKTMLGVKSVHAPLKGESARRFLEKLVRVQTGHLNSEDREDIEYIRKREKDLPELQWPEDLMPTE